jgi:iron complex outermembrane receptor protein
VPRPDQQRPQCGLQPWHTGGGADISTFLYDNQQEQRSSTQKNVELHLNGSVFNLPAGRIRYAVGGEYNTDGVNSREVNVFTGSAVSRSRYAFFGEMTLPVFGSKFSLPLLRELVFTGALRNDTYMTDGAIGTVGGVRFDLGGQIIYGKSTFSHYTPAYGLRWAPVRDLVFRAKWSSGFRAPPPTQLFNVLGTQITPSYIFGDPLYTCTPNVDCVFGTNTYAVPSTTAPNPNLKPQTSNQQNFSAQWTPSGVLHGLSVNVTYNRTIIHNEYANMSDLLSVMRSTDIYRLAQFYPRDPVSNKIIAAQNMTYNISGSEYSSVNVEAHYQINTGIGTFTPSINYLRNLKSQRAIFEGTAPISTLGTVSGVDRYKIQASIPWNYKNLDVTLWGYYTPPYLNNYLIQQYAGYVSNTDEFRPVRSFTTFDLTASWQIRKHLRLNFAGRNIFAAAPPFVVIDSRPYDTARYNAAGRTFSFEIQKSF